MDKKQEPQAQPQSFGDIMSMMSGMMSDPEALMKNLITQPEGMRLKLTVELLVKNGSLLIRVNPNSEPSK